MMNWTIESSWAELLGEEFAKDYFQSLKAKLEAEYAAQTVYPPAERIFHAFELTPVGSVKVVILGQDPYHEPGQAQGLAFYVPKGVRTPPSLVNIAKELREEYPQGTDPNSLKPTIPDLKSWAKQGVLLLNTTLTVRAGAPLSHQHLGWEQFTDAAIRRLSETRRDLVFLLWGAYAQKKSALVDATRHLVLRSAHPSPLSARRGFFGCGHFKSANEFLQAHALAPIIW